MMRQTEQQCRRQREAERAAAQKLPESLGEDADHEGELGPEEDDDGEGDIEEGSGHQPGLRPASEC